MSDTTPCAHHQFFGAREFCPDCGLSRAEVLVEACAPFLKDDETPAECIARNRQDASGCLTMLIDERRKVESLRSRLAEADALIAKGLAVVHDFLPNIGRCVLQDYQRMNEFCSEAAARAAVSAVQPERCCLDYPRCDCNSPPEPDSISDSAEVKP